MYEIFEKLLAGRGITAYRFCKDTGVSSSTISTWKKKNSKCGTELAEIIANYFEVTMDYLMTGKNPDGDFELSVRDERDIKKDLDAILLKLKSREEGPAAYDGEEIPEEDIDMFAGQVEIMLRRLKAINKEKYNPRKNGR